MSKAGMLLLSVLVTRLLSATMFYHFTFMAVGLAMLVLGARLLVRAATEMATALGLSELVIGLTVVAIPYDSPGIVAYFTVVRTGSREEVEPGHSGFAHFFEHMMFRGTERFSDEEYNDVLKRLGVDSNAFTTDDYTNYYMIGPSAELETMMDIESDRFKNLKYGEEDFKTEALAVLGEYNKNVSSPFLPMYERLRELAFTKHTYAHTTMGYLEDIQAMPGYYDYSLKFFDRFYRPDNTVLLIVGDVEPKRVFDLAKKFYGDWKKGYQPVDIATEPAPTEGPKTALIEWPAPIRPHLMMAWRSPAFSTDTEDTAALHLLSQLLFSQSSPLYQELVVDEQWVDYVQGGQDDRRDPYLFSVFSRVKSDDLLPKVEAAIAQHVAALQKEPVETQRLERIKSHLRYDFALDLNSPGAVAFTVAQMLSLTGDPSSINELYRQYENVTPADVQRVAADLGADGIEVGDGGLEVVAAGGVAASPTGPPRGHRRGVGDRLPHGRPVARALIDILSPERAEAFIRANTALFSEKATVTEYLTLDDGDLMTVTTILDDPVYMEEPHLQSISYRRNVHQELPFFPCTVGVENVQPGFPHFLPGENPYVAEAADKLGLPVEAVKGGAETLYPEYRETLREMLRSGASN